MARPLSGSPRVGVLIEWSLYALVRSLICLLKKLWRFRTGLISTRMRSLQHAAWEFHLEMNKSESHPFGWLSGIYKFGLPKELDSNHVLEPQWFHLSHRGWSLRAASVRVGNVSRNRSRDHKRGKPSRPCSTCLRSQWFPSGSDCSRLC